MLSLNPRLVTLFAGAYAAGTVIGTRISKSTTKKRQHGKHKSLGVFTEENKGGEL
jgi:hypothetical protein